MGRVRAGGLTGGELEEIRVRAQESLAHIERTRRLEDAGAIFTSPASARVAMRARNDADRLAWARVVEALAAGS